MISVIVPACDEEAYIGRTLAALAPAAGAAPDATPFEVIVVANGCRDATAERAAAAGARVVVTPVAGVSRARNLGARAAVGDVLVFLDADTRLSPGALDAFAAAISSQADYGTCRIRPDGGGWRAVATTTLLAWGHRLAGTSLGVLACTRALFDRAGGFDERLVAGEDNALNARLARLGGRRVYLGRIDAWTSMRRFERCGYLRTHLAWLRGVFHPPDRYEVVR